MAEQVTELDLGVTWEPNVPDAMLVADDFGKTVLALKAHLDDRDQRCVVLVWDGTFMALMGSPNDEAVSGHRLYSKGLGDVTWAAQVHESELVQELERQNRVHPSHDPARFEALAHHVVMMKESVAEVVAEAVAVVRIDGSTLHAAVAAMRQ